MIYDSFPVMDIDDKLQIRELRDTDLQHFFNFVKDPRVNRFMADDDIPKTLEESVAEMAYWKNLFPERRSVYWGIALKPQDKLIGTCGYNNWSRTHKRGEISYDLSAVYWNKGFTTKCVRAICDFGFSKMNLHRIQATVALDNGASIRVLEKIGFKKEGVMKGYGLLHSHFKDFYMYGLIKTDMKF